MVLLSLSYVLTPLLLLLVAAAQQPHPPTAFAAPAAASNNNTIHSEMQALLTLKQSLDDPMGFLDGWAVVHLLPQQPDNVTTHAATMSINYTASPCTWSGVSCNYIHNWDSTTNRDNANPMAVVVALDLSYMNLSGVVSPAIAELHNLVSLSLAANNLTGELPAEVCDIGPSLRYLNLSNNMFSGEFPARNLSKLAQLEVLDVYNNDFEGPLPVEISKLRRSMRHLHLGGNYFNGSIPPQLGGMQSLVYLALSGNSLTGRIPLELGNLALLRELYLGYYNQFDGGIPPSLGSLTQLSVLDMAQCGLTGTIPPQLFRNLTNLQSLFLYTNSLTGPIPHTVGNLVHLRFFDLSNNRLSGSIPAEMRNMSSLQLLHLFRNQIGGSIPSFVGDLPSLHVLALWQNQITGLVPQQLGSNRNLIYVDLSSNLLTGQVPSGICSGSNLQVLILFNNFFSGPIPDSLSAKCWQLQRLRLGNNRLSGTIPTDLLALPGLQMIEMQSNHLTGTIPEIAGFNTQLGRLDLSNNHLSGPIPPSIANFSALESLLLGGNSLSGSLPNEISSLDRLSKLDCSNNRIVGPIPSKLSMCSSLTYLDLSSNRLDGTIPPQLHNLTVLNFLNLSRNHLTGSLPLSLQEMQTLTSADFSYNNLSGAIPEGGQFSAFNASSFMGNRALCGAQLLIPCTTNATAPSSKDNSLGNGDTDEEELFRSRVRREPEIFYWLVVGIISALTLAVLLAAIFCNRHTLCHFINRRGSSGMIRYSGASSWKLTAFQKLDFGASHVLACLTDENIIGKGASGTVYKCATPSGYVAVKRLPSTASKTVDNAAAATGGRGGGSGGGMVKLEVVCGSSQDDHGFSAEIETLGKIRHRNIVKLLGCCSSRETNFLVYEYMPNGSLGELLHGPKGGSALDWSLRYKIALDAANGLRYLHHDCSPRIIHRDVKSNNILLDSKFEAHVADFGLAKALNTCKGPNNDPESMTSVAGSYGYIAPEYVYTLTVDEKSDTYSFGTVLLELLTGKRPLEPEFGEGVNIAQWAKSKVKNVGKQGNHGMLQVIDEILDSRLAPSMAQQQQQALVLLRIALRCVSDLPAQRPSMHEVVQILSDHAPSPSPSDCNLYTRARTIGTGCATINTSMATTQLQKQRQQHPHSPSSTGAAADDILMQHHLATSTLSSSTDLDIILNSAKSTDALLASCFPANPSNSSSSNALPTPDLISL